jgi:hypothetical protein
MHNSGTLLDLDRAGLPYPVARFDATHPREYTGILPKARLIVCNQPDVRHYAAKRVPSSTGCQAEREIKSKGLSYLHHGGADTRSITTSDQPSRSAGQSHYDRDRRT